MLNDNLVFPWCILDTNKNIIENGDGAIFELPSTFQQSKWNEQKIVEGWGKCNNGFAFFCRKLPLEGVDDTYLVLYGLKVKELQTKAGKDTAFTINITKNKIEEYVKSIFLSLEQEGERILEGVWSYIHDIRGLNAALSHAATELRTAASKDALDQESIKHLSKLAGNIEATSGIMKNRTDVIDLLINDNAKSQRKEHYFVYRRFDRTQRCFKVLSGAKKITIGLSGESMSAVYGPPVFDVIPYILFENAIKYSPKNNHIECNITEDSKHITCTVKSLGPEISTEELANIFKKGVRGHNAQQSGVQGSGVGLYLLKYVVEELFGGKVSILQAGQKFRLNNCSYIETSFEVDLPKRSE